MEQAGFKALNTDSDGFILGLFNESHIQYAADREDDIFGEPPLSEMTQKAAHSRAIEYQLGETVHGKREIDWSYRNQLISDVLLKSMHRVKSYGKGCEQVIQLIQARNKDELLIEWMPQLKSLKSFQFKGQQHQENWQLVAFDTQSVKAETYFNQLYTCQTVDYADIRGAHTDKFLNEMVTLSFVESNTNRYVEGGESNFSFELI
jgi:hypothetical protein